MSTSKIRRICLFSGPGAGKSTLAALVFGQLKLLGYSVELISEYIKQWAYEKRKLDGFDQLYIYAKQLRLEERVLRENVDLIISDSPLLLQCYYSSKYNFKAYSQLFELSQLFDKEYPPLNLFLKRHEGVYETNGRFQNLQEAKNVDKELKDYLDQNNISYIEVDNNVDAILDKIKEFVNRK